MPLKGHPLGYWRLKLQAMTLLVFARSASAERTFDTMLSHWPGDAYALASRAHVRAERGARELAIADAQALVARHPQRSAADWFNLAYLLEDAGRYDEAIPAFRRAVELDPKLDRAWYGLGLTLIRLKRLDEAVEALKHNTRLQPMSPYGWYQLARVHLDRHEPDETRKIIRHLHGFEPKVAAQLERETGLAP
jgi:tetratricopeptide (TPR) repeat protein